MKIVEERRKADQQKHELMTIQLMGSVFRETSNQQQPQRSIAHLSLPYPATCDTTGVIQTPTDELVESMHETNLDNDTNEPTKRPKQHQNMDVNDHPKLTIPTPEVNMGF